MFGNLTVQAAHDPCQSHGTVPVADHQIVACQLEFLLVQSLDTLPFLRPSNDDFGVFQHIQVEGMHRLTDFK